MSSSVRLACPQDRTALEQLAASKPYYDSIFVDAAGLKAWTCANVGKLLEQQTPRLQLWLAGDPVQAYLALNLDSRESITLESQSQIVDFFAPNYQLLELLLNQARQLTQAGGNDWLVANLLAKAQREQLWFYRWGFRAELNRTVRAIPAGFGGASSPRYPARPAKAGEQLFIMRVNAVHCANYRPHGRDTDPQIIRANFLASYADLDLKDPNWHYLILEDSQEKRPAAYIILIREELPLGLVGYYTYDVAAAPEYYGRGLSLYLAGAAESLVGQAGGGFLYGDSNPSNLAVVNGDRTLGYLLDSQRWGYDCRK